MPSNINVDDTDMGRGLLMLPRVGLASPDARAADAPVTTHFVKLPV